jgi:hypothetical protein
VAAGLVLAALSSLPFYASLLMPDVLIALIIMNAMLILRGVERLTPLEWGFVFLATSFAVVSHHGHVPVAAALAGWSCCCCCCADGFVRWRWRLPQGRSWLPSLPT